MPIYKECTFGELMTVAITTLFILMIVLCVLAKIILNELFIGYIFATVLVLPITKIVLTILQKYKAGKPYGYYQHVLIKKIRMSTFAPLLKLNTMIRIGTWSVRRK